MDPTAQIKLAQDDVDEIERSFPGQLATTYIKARTMVLVLRHLWMQHAHVIERGGADDLKHLSELWDLLEHVRKLIPYIVEKAKTRPALWNPKRPEPSDLMTIPETVQFYVRKARLFQTSVLLACNARYRAAYDDAWSLKSRAKNDHTRLRYGPERGDDTTVAVAKDAMERASVDFYRLTKLDAKAVAALFPQSESEHEDRARAAPKPARLTRADPSQLCERLAPTSPGVEDDSDGESSSAESVVIATTVLSADSQAASDCIHHANYLWDNVSLKVTSMMSPRPSLQHPDYVTTVPEMASSAHRERTNLPQDELDEVKRFLSGHMATTYYHARITVLVARNCWVQHAELIKEGADEELESLWRNLGKAGRWLLDAIRAAKKSWLSTALGVSPPVRDALRAYVGLARRFRQDVLDVCNVARLKGSDEAAKSLRDRTVASYSELANLPELNDDQSGSGLLSPLGSESGLPGQAPPKPATAGVAQELEDSSPLAERFRRVVRAADDSAGHDGLTGLMTPPDPADLVEIYKLQQELDAGLPETADESEFGPDVDAWYRSFMMDSEPVSSS
ncbi:hypothetical protein PUNSTDRAFT_123330 [Punctularia strigosozonata HHB-11173 SS5]|uniref:uncharacterized protein n=1 Tax=Punctularia strigosozonata (strain HHB-11173) TaxID=741275 RepID=UPI0004417BC4|nr:uncharacterized protein PUNSTDRAFT_123330 [Punctularia strigosozonata HHB-11173 SS5]EIN13154.1 hypothetical protein PUNSTDRAFT_123330 [Punctularia strigosozonata HHB-11173 SS5]